MIESPIGKTCTVDMLTSPSIAGVIKHQPAATGDSWVIERDDGTVFYVQTFAAMRIHKEPSSASTGVETVE